MSSKVVICGINTSLLPKITEEQSEHLLKKVAEGDDKAREEFIVGNMRLVLSVIKRFSAKSKSADDLFQAGCIGLIKAMDNFDLAQNVRFSTYAVPMKGFCRKAGKGEKARRIKRTFLDKRGSACYADLRL